MTAPSPSLDSTSLAPTGDVEPEPSSGARPSVATIADRYLAARERARLASDELTEIGDELMKAMEGADVRSVPMGGRRIWLVRAVPRALLDRTLCELTIAKLRAALDEAAGLLAEHGIPFNAPALGSTVLKASSTPRAFLAVHADREAPRSATTRELA